MGVRSDKSSHHRWRRLAITVFGFLAIALLYLLFWPIKASPAAWNPPIPPDLKLPPYLSSAEMEGRSIHVGSNGPEDVAFDGAGRLYTGCENGQILRVSNVSSGGSVEQFADTGGRPLGLQFDAKGHLIVCDAHLGLLGIDDRGTVQTLATTSITDQIPFAYTNDLDIAADGTIYFTDASHRFGIEHTNDALAEHVAQGRLLAYDPATGEARTLLNNFYFANGVALSADESFVLVADTGNYTIRRYWLKGARTGTAETLIHNLPGFPDGISYDRTSNTFWVAIVSPRDPLADWAHNYPMVKRAVLRLPRTALLRLRPFGMILGVDENGSIVHSIIDESGHIARNITNVVEHEGTLYCGSLSISDLFAMPVPR